MAESITHPLIQTQVAARLVYGPPKSRSSLRTNALPDAIRPAILEHLTEYVNGGPDAWLFTGERETRSAVEAETCLPAGWTRSRASTGPACIC